MTFKQAGLRPGGRQSGRPAYQLSNLSHPSDTTITLVAGMTAQSIAITNTTYPYLTMRNGDPYGFVQRLWSGRDFHASTSGATTPWARSSARSSSTWPITGARTRPTGTS
ncbi:MAG: DUF4465 domain-containing protein [Isosphaeraceae bacterium]